MTFSPPYSLTPLIVRQLKAIESARGFLEAVRERPDWAEQVRREARVRDALASVRLEGNRMTFNEAFALLSSPPDRELVDSEREFMNYLRAFDDVDGLRGERDYVVSRRDLLNIHRRLVSGVRGGDRFAGQFRREAVKVGDIGPDGAQTIHHEPPPWQDVEGHVEALMAWTEHVKHHPSRKAVLGGAPDPWVHPVIAAGIAQHRLAWIHPFVDGNGRTARMVTTMLLYQRGYDFKLLFDLSSYYDRDRDAYYDALRAVDETGDYTAWLVYFLGGFAWQMVAVKEKALKMSEALTPSVRGDDDTA